MTSDLSNERASLIAASQASEAVHELLRFYQEGPASDRAFGDVEVVSKLAEALKLACDIECHFLADFPHAKEEHGEVSRLGGICANFIEGWAG